jgi:glycosyltransferase involved in cell wall biosynthesis
MREHIGRDKAAMKVALVTYFPKDPESPHGGVEAVSVNIARALSSFQDIDVHVVTTTTEKDQAEKGPVRWGNVTLHRLQMLGGSTLINAIGAGRRQISGYLHALRPDIVHAHDTFGIMVKGLPFARVFTIHGFIYGDTLVSGERFAWLRSRIWKLIENSSWADQPHIISISPYVRERLSGIATGIIHDIDNPISDAFFNIDRNERKGTIFSAAVISPRKNTLALIDALGILAEKGLDAKLRLAGSVTEPRYGRQVEERIKTLGLAGKVKLLGKVNTHAIQEEISSASVFVLASLEENSPMGIEEAMAAGVPVVTSNRCGMPYMVRHGESGYLVDPLKPNDIAWRVGSLLEDDVLRASMGKRSKEIARDRFHPESVARRTREVYLESFRGWRGK